jgi:acetyl/propionyl-CoA carboxylase alpha subunit
LIASWFSILIKASAGGGGKGNACGRKQADFESQMDLSVKQLLLLVTDLYY